MEHYWSNHGIIVLIWLEITYASRIPYPKVAKTYVKIVEDCKRVEEWAKIERRVSLNNRCNNNGYANVKYDERYGNISPLTSLIDCYNSKQEEWGRTL